MLILEAKKEGIYFELPSGFSTLEYKLSSLFKDNPQIREGITQALQYCQTRGTLLGAVCNGHQIIAFVASRNDGLPPLEGKAIVFDSLEKMKENFLTFWQSLSKPGVQAKNLHNRLLGESSPQIPAKLSATITAYPGFKQRNVLQSDLQVVSELVIEDITRARDLETDFIKDCFCSSGALSQYALVNKSILENRYAALFLPGSDSPTLTSAMNKKGVNREIIAESLSKRPIILLGDVGVGKTMFIRYLLKVGAVDIIKNTIVFYIDLGSQASLVPNLYTFFLNEMEEQLLKNEDIDIRERNFVRGVYNLDLQRFSKGVNSDLKKNNEERYRSKEIEFLEERIKNLPEHLKHSLIHISKGRQKQLMIVLDNADQRKEDIQQDAFINAQEFASSWPVTVYIAMRPRTFHRSKESGALSGYHPKAFTISPPRVDEVILKRLRFALRITRGEIVLASLPPDTSIKLVNLKKYFEVIIRSFEKNRELVEFIDNICSGNIRLALEFVTAFISSGHVNTQKILDTEKETCSYIVPLHEFLRAVIYGDNEYYNPGASPIANLFDITTPDPREHFLLPILVGFINTHASSAGSEGFVQSEAVYRYAQDKGFSPEQIRSALNRGTRKNLLESEARLLALENNSQLLLRVTTVGVYHTKKLVRLFPYIDAIVIDTPILDEDCREKINNEFYIKGRLERAEIFVNYLDNQWNLVDAEPEGFNWPPLAQAVRRDIERIRRNLHRDA